jgi:hypothetical protein
MVCRKVAEIHESEPDSMVGVFPMPKVVRLGRYIVTKRRYTNGPAWSRQGVLNRDGRRRAYCNVAAATIDTCTRSRALSEVLGEGSLHARHGLRDHVVRSYPVVPHNALAPAAKHARCSVRA